MLSGTQKSYNNINQMIMTMGQELQKQIMIKVKKIKCQQPDCRSSNQQTLQVAVVGDQKIKRKGVMCTSCFIDQELFVNFGNVQHHALSIQKFLKVLTEKYLDYRQQKNNPEWPPTQVEAQRQQIRSKIKELETVVKKGIFDIMKYLQDGIKEASDKAKSTNHEKNLEKLVELLGEQDESEQQRMKLSNQLKELSSKIVKEHGDYHLNTQDEIKKQNEMIMLEFRKKITKAKDAVNKLVQIHKKCLKHLIE